MVSLGLALYVVTVKSHPSLPLTDTPGLQQGCFTSPFIGVWTKLKKRNKHTGENHYSSMPHLSHVDSIPRIIYPARTSEVR
jgi:hypothetical protein